MLCLSSLRCVCAYYHWGMVLFPTAVGKSQMTKICNNWTPQQHGILKISYKYLFLVVECNYSVKRNSLIHTEVSTETKLKTPIYKTLLNSSS